MATYPTENTASTAPTTTNATGSPLKPVTAYAIVITPVTTVSGVVADAVNAAMSTALRTRRDCVVGGAVLLVTAGSGMGQLLADGVVGMRSGEATLDNLVRRGPERLE